MSLLQRVHDRLGGLGVDIQTFGESDRVEIRWRRDYDGEWSDERFASATSIGDALQAVLDYEDRADGEDAQESVRGRTDEVARLEREEEAA